MPFGASPLAANEVRGVQVGSQNRSKNAAKMGRHLGIDFSAISVDFWEQIRKENATKTDTTTHR